MTAALDTNVLVYAEGSNGARPKAAALRLLRQMPADRTLIPVQVLGEPFAVVAILSTTNVGPAIAKNTEPLMAFITNDSSHPVPVVFPTPVDVVSPLWQGEPSAVRAVVLNPNDDGFQFCNVAFTAEPGTAVSLKTVTAAYNVPPGAAGSLGFPVIAARGCLSGVMAAAGVSLLGFTVPLPQ